MKGYAYLDQHGILHIVSSPENAKGKTVETSLPFGGGFPEIEKDGKRKTVVIYGLDEMYIEGNRTSFKTGEGKKVNIDDYPAYKELYIACME